MEYIGEHLWVGKLGHFFIALSFVSSFVGVVSYFFAEKKKEVKEGVIWKKMGRYSFLIQGISVFAVIGLIFYIMTERMYEYAYAYNHVSDDLPMKYILSAFWEGQEGSFLLWMFWHIVLGAALLFRTKVWENGVMMFLSLIQGVLSSFLLGVHIGGTKIGINPFVLLRDTMDIPLFQQADYLTKLTGSGLNPLLQNYWMTIHPPTLFLGFASVSIPFCFAAAVLFKEKYDSSWLKPTLSWALFSVFTLGAGILMGGAWAYEALNFGGYWAWDPVENMSLVPWLMLIAGVHMNLVAKATGQSIKSTIIFYLLSFVLVFYSTFLTRSGVLGDTSVHAFTELGLELHLVLGVFLFIGISLYYYYRNKKNIPVPVKEEANSSKEFWMFIGALVLMISALLISISTSFPVFNKIIDGVAWLLGTDFSEHHLASPEDPIAHYNKYQIWIALFIGLLSGLSQFLRYKERDFTKIAKKYWTRTGITFVLSLVLTVLSAQIIEMNAWQYYPLTFACWYAVISNLDFLVSVARTNFKLVGSVLAHVGFGLMILGSLISGLNQHHISTNVFAQKGIIDGFTDEDYNKNILLIKNKPMMMKGYEVTYKRDTLDGFNRYFTVHYKKKNNEGKTVQEFELEPYVIYDKTFTKVASTNPSTQHYWNRDIFTHIASLPRAETDKEYARSVEDSLNYKTHSLVEDEVWGTENLEVRFVKTVVNAQHPDYKPVPGDFSFGTQLSVRDKKTDKTYNIMPVAVIRGAKMIRFPIHISDLNTKIKLSKEVFDEIVWDDELKYKPYNVNKGGVFKVGDTEVVFNGFGSNPTAPDYIPEEGDKAFNALLDFEVAGQKYQAQPIYFIRKGMPYQVKDEIKALDWHFKIGNIDPKSELVTILVAEGKPHEERISFQIAEDVPSNDYIVLEAIVFPGINLFWLGSCLMLLGSLVAMFYRAFRS